MQRGVGEGGAHVPIVILGAICLVFIALTLSPRHLHDAVSQHLREEGDRIIGLRGEVDFGGILESYAEFRLREAVPEVEYEEWVDAALEFYRYRYGGPSGEGRSAQPVAIVEGWSSVEVDYTEGFEDDFIGARFEEVGFVVREEGERVGDRQTCSVERRPDVGIRPSVFLGVAVLRSSGGNKTFVRCTDRADKHSHRSNSLRVEMFATYADVETLLDPHSGWGMGSAHLEHTTRFTDKGRRAYLHGTITFPHQGSTIGAHACAATGRKLLWGEA